MLLKLRSILFLLTTLFGGVSVLAQEHEACANTRVQWKLLITSKPTSQTSLQMWSQWQEEKNIALKCLAKEIFRDFLIVNKKISYKDLVTDSLDQKILEAHLQKEALEQTLTFFDQSTAPEAQIFKRQIADKANREGIGFSAVESMAVLGEMPAGYIRAQGHVALNYALMDRNDWIFLFIHEFSHLIDQNLEKAVHEAVVFYQKNPNFVLEMMTKVKNISNLSELPAQEQDEINLYLKLSLERGWIAEIVAWANTLKIYEALRKKGKIEAVVWAEDILKRKPIGLKWNAFFAEYLKATFSYPNNSIYSNALIRQRSDEIEQTLLRDLIARPDGIINH